MNTILKEGLRPTPKDPRDFPLGAIVSMPKLSELPASFSLTTLGVKDQGDSDFCAAFATSMLSEIQEGIELSPEYQFALGKKVSGEVEEWGLDLRSVLKGASKYGSLPQKIAPYSLKDHDTDFLRRIENWGGALIGLSAPQKKKSFFEITGPYDAYDNIRAAIWKFRNSKQGVLSGVVWGWPLEAAFLEGVSPDGFGHAIGYIGWTEKGLVLQNSAGLGAGIRGCHIVSRETVNHFVGLYKAYMMVDMDPEDARYYLETGSRADDLWFVGIFKAIWNAVFKRKKS